MTDENPTPAAPKSPRRRWLGVIALALVREIARAHGGDARYEGRPGGGSRFVVELTLSE